MNSVKEGSMDFEPLDCAFSSGWKAESVVADIVCPLGYRSILDMLLNATGDVVSDMHCRLDSPDKLNSSLFLNHHIGNNNR
ncbi:hypothetical protein L2E82_43923 [Cichorium intybus]|uniref:Uncharacterized protein n=1 Tax=Cichorium intybus TaxID=13427 RepID=A0ACB8ZQE3_CICIN|nr:hypothetical protein L2E82_43923 [Cichorium intybus]